MPANSIMNEGKFQFERSIKARIAGLDELRGIAVLWVMICHGAAISRWIPDEAAGWGMAGVILFFFISGYLITRILIEAKESPNYFIKFYVRRILRIWPLMLVTLTVSAVLFPETAKFIWFNLSLTNNYWASVGGTVMERTDVMWSLAIEEQFYLLWPLLIFVLPQRYLSTVCLVAMSISFLFSKGIIPYNQMAIFKTTHGNLIYLLLGCGLATGRNFFRWSLAALTMLSAIWGIQNGFKEAHYNMPNWIFNLLWLGFYALTAHTLFGFFGKWRLRSFVLAKLGELCFGLYLIHFFVSYFTIQIFGFNSSFLELTPFNRTDQTARFSISRL